MATSVSNADYINSRPAIRTRPSISGVIGNTGSPRSPRTPLLNRSISSQFGSPGSFRIEQEDVVIFELNQRYFAAGYAGESRPRSILPFTPGSSHRAGDYGQYDKAHARNMRKYRLGEDWASSHELYQVDLGALDLGLVEDKLDRALRKIHVDYLQMDSKPRKVLLVVPSMVPTPLLGIALKVLFGHFTQPPSISILTNPVLSCASAGLRHALVIDIGWEETTITAVGEYKEIMQRRSVRAGKMLTKEMADVIEHELAGSDVKITFEETEDLVQRMAWCRSRRVDSEESPQVTVVHLPTPGSVPTTDFPIDFVKLAEPAERTFFAPQHLQTDHDDHDIPIHLLAHKLLLSLPVDLRSTCISRIVLTGSYTNMLGLKQRLLQEISYLVQSRGWDVVSNYGSARQRHERVLWNEPIIKEASTGSTISQESVSALQDPTVMPLVPASDRVHDDIHDPVTIKAERGKGGASDSDASNVVRGVESLGAWAGASLVASLKIQGVHEIDKDDFNKHGFRGI
ncbi:fungal-specific actin related protein [Dissoconium aciculare CBS 342.82]|uniref:Fungal-specific actin related protein n=1 Tax=Dissoconium aciculare CBS 342.82 TaxID=1314786 RepID=A0A6J3MC76_9PEZI|nr:fungal-specific actin related protein [Dissoconium aciculare CBS 342.82]KAF1825615.1 fungal-specific actin related protein [Dissoconium aciculare CBS 342.82]